MRTTIDTLNTALADLLGAQATHLSGARLDVHFESGQRAAATFETDGTSILIATPVDGAHRGVSKDRLKALLARNGPEGALAGGSLRLRPNQDYLEIANALPADLDPRDVAQIMINQSNAAQALVQQVARNG